MRSVVEIFKLGKYVPEGVPLKGEFHWHGSGLTISCKDGYHIAMDADEKDKKAVKQPENMVYYKPREELYSTLHMCIYLRELPEVTPEEARAISERDQNPDLKVEN